MAKLLSQAVTLLPNPLRNMDEDSAALALVSPGPAKGHVFPVSAAWRPLTPLGPAWSLGHEGCSEQCISHLPWPWAGQEGRIAGIVRCTSAHHSEGCIRLRELQRHIWAEGMHWCAWNLFVGLFVCVISNGSIFYIATS